MTSSLRSAARPSPAARTAVRRTARWRTARWRTAGHGALYATVGCGAVLLSGCGGTSTPVAGPTATVTTTVQPTGPASSAAGAAPSSPAAPAGPQPCATSALHATIGTGNAAAGSSYYPLKLTNISASSCTVFGYPGVSFVTGVGGSQIGVPAARSPGSSKLITLAPGATGHATLQVVDALNYPSSNCTLAKANWLKVFPPGQFTALYLKFSAQACASPHTERILAIQPFAPGASGQ